MGRSSRSRLARQRTQQAAWRAAAEAARRPLPDGILLGREAMEALARAGASVSLLLPDPETGTGYLRQWYMPTGDAESFAAMMTSRCGPPAEVFIDPGMAIEAGAKMILATGDIGAFGEPGTSQD